MDHAGAAMTEIDSQLDDLKSLVIMAVDDEPTVIEVLETFLESEGYTNLVNTTTSSTPPIRGAPWSCSRPRTPTCSSSI
jgi:PleD family two-component response regulator